MYKNIKKMTSEIPSDMNGLLKALGAKVDHWARRTPQLVGLLLPDMNGLLKAPLAKVDQWARWTPQLVGGLLPCSTSLHEDSQWHFYYTQKRDIIHRINLTETEHKNLNRSGISGHQWLNGTGTMEKTFRIIPRNLHTYHSNLPG